MTHSDVPAQLFIRRRPRPDARALWFCFPYAGGSAATFREWPAAVAGRLDVEILAAELPGHGRRLGEPPDVDIPRLADAMTDYIDRPYVIFGHSLGARLGFELCRQLGNGGVAAPLRLCVSGSPGPRLPRVGQGDSLLPDEEFIARVSRMGGTPAKLLHEPQLRELFLPVLRADFCWGDTYTYQEGPALDCPITALAGTRDPEAPPEQVATWAKETSHPTRLHVVDGDHFFIHSALDAVVTALQEDLPELSPHVPVATG